jgi:hypothetical protein
MLRDRQCWNFWPLVVHDKGTWFWACARFTDRHDDVSATLLSIKTENYHVNS